MSLININQIMTLRNANHKLINDVKEKFFSVSMVVCVRGWDRLSEKPAREVTAELTYNTRVRGNTPICEAEG